MDFNLQTFLQDMEKRAEERHNRLEQKIDDTLMTVADHETRITVVEQTPPADHEARLIKIEGVVKVSRWFVGTAIGAGLAGLFSWITSIFTGSVK